MKRTQLTRKTPLARGSRLQRGGPLTIRRVSKRFAKRRDPGYCRWIRTLPCCVAGRGYWIDCRGLELCSGPVECAHVMSRGAGGFDVANTVPLCRRHHREQHTLGIRSFEARYSVNLENKALYYGAMQPPKYERDCPGIFGAA